MQYQVVCGQDRCMRNALDELEKRLKNRVKKVGNFKGESLLQLMTTNGIMLAKQ